MPRRVNDALAVDDGVGIREEYAQFAQQDVLTQCER